MLRFVHEPLGGHQSGKAAGAAQGSWLRGKTVRSGGRMYVPSKGGLLVLRITAMATNF